MGNPHPKIIAIEIGHLSKSTLSGGDKLLLDLMPYLCKQPLQIIIPTIAAGHWLKWQNQTIQITSANYMSRIISAVKELTNINPHIIISSTNYYPDVLSAWVYKALHPQVVWIARILHIFPTPFGRPGNFFVNLLAFLGQSFCLFLSNSWANMVLALNPDIYNQLSTPRKDILPAGIDVKKIQAIKSIKSTPRFDVVFVGRFHQSKGINDLPKIMDFLPQYSLGVIGEGSVSWRRSNITILGRINDRQKIQILKLAKVFICTDYEAGWGLAIAEAMASGLPVVAYHLPIFGQVFKRGFITAPLGNTEKLAEAVAYLLTNPKRRIQLGKLAQAQGFSLRVPATKYISILGQFARICA